MPGVAVAQPFLSFQSRLFHRYYNLVYNNQVMLINKNPFMAVNVTYMYKMFLI